MGKPLRPRHGSMQFWPRKKAKSESTRLRAKTLQSSEAKLLGFAGYKAGMTHISFTDGRKNSITKGETVTTPVTIIECPPVTIIGARAYNITENGFQPIASTFAEKLPKDIKQALVAKDAKTDFTKFEGAKEVRAIVSTKPSDCGFGRKKADVFEMPIGGDAAAQLAFVKEKLGQTVAVSDVFQAGSQVDTHSVTKGKGFQGSVKRFGVNLTSHKSEKARRGPGSLGGWKGHMHFMYRLPMAGQVGYHQRTDYNKIVLMIGDDVAKVNPKSGINSYGLVKTTYMLIKGSVSGPKKRLIKFTNAIRPNDKLEGFAPEIEYISTEAQN